MTLQSDSFENWLIHNDELGKTTAAASLVRIQFGSCLLQQLVLVLTHDFQGMIYLWNPDSGLAQLGKYLKNDDDYIVAGALLGIGIASCSVKDDCDTVCATLLYSVHPLAVLAMQVFCCNDLLCFPDTHSYF
jgi:26S proteasome regulatory subunit N1